MPWNCPWSRERRPPAVSPPLQILEKEGVAQAHAFRSKSFRKPQPCHWCHQPVRAHGSCCRVCKYVCHTTCENKVAAAEQGAPAPAPAHANNPDRARFSDTSWQIHRTWRREGDPLPLSPPPRAAAAAVPLRADQNGIYDTITDENISSGALNNTVGPVEMKENGVLCQPSQARNSENLLMAVQSPAINKDSIVLQNVTQPVEATEHTLLFIQPSATSTDSNAQQNVTAEIQIDNAATLNVMVLAKLETLQENYQTLNEKITESIKAQQEERKIIHENVQSMLLGLSNISVQFEYVMNQFSRVENHKQNEKIQTITSEEDLNNFEKVLENQEKEEEWKNKFSIICGKGKGRGVNNAYALVDSMFSRSFLLQCSWAGGSRTSDQKICFKSHTKIINFFFNIIRESDSSFSLVDCHKFFKNILKNSRQRNESKQERTSRTKNRPKIKANRKNLCNKTQPSLPIAGTSAPENSSSVSLPAVGKSGSGSENRSEVVLENSGPDNYDNDPMSSASVAGILTKPLETPV